MFNKEAFKECLKKIFHPVNLIFIAVIITAHNLLLENFKATASVCIFYGGIALCRIIQGEWDFVVPSGKHLGEIVSIIVIGYLSYFMFQPFL